MFITTDDMESKDTMKNAREKLGSSSESAMPCKDQNLGHRETCGEIKPNTRNSKYACIVEVWESTRKRLGKNFKDHEDRIAGKGFNSMSHYNLLHKFIPMPQTMKIPDAKVAVDKGWEELEKLLLMQKTKFRSKKEVIQEAQKEGRTVHFASLMDICHLKNAELEPKQYQLPYTLVKMENASNLLKMLKSECPDIWICLPRRKWPKSW